MRFYYGEKNILRVLDESEFWKRQETEHTIVIHTIVPNLEVEFVRQLEEFEIAFRPMEGKAIQLMECVIRSKGRLGPELRQEIILFIEAALSQSHQFIKFLDTLLSQSMAVKANPTAQVVINHIRRESEYFIGIAQVILKS
jgi:hypothetical protein